MTKYLYPKQIIFFHKQLVTETGGSHGIRDKGLLESAIYRPQSSFSGQDFYPDLFMKAAVLGYSLISNHPFIDGNKRVGYLAMRVFLRMNGFDLKATIDVRENFIMSIAMGELAEKEMMAWLKKNSCSRV